MKDKKAEDKPKSQSAPVAPPPPVPVKQEPVNKEVKKELQKSNGFLKNWKKNNYLNNTEGRIEAMLASPDVFSDKNKFLATEREYKSVADSLKETGAQYEKVFESIIDLESQ